jgi:hypothetical protein
MLSLFRSLIDRVKVLLAVRAVQELEAEALAAGAVGPRPCAGWRPGARPRGCPR